MIKPERMDYLKKGLYMIYSSKVNEYSTGVNRYNIIDFFNFDNVISYFKIRSNYASRSPKKSIVCSICNFCSY